MQDFQGHCASVLEQCDRGQLLQRNGMAALELAVEYVQVQQMAEMEQVRNQGIVALRTAKAEHQRELEQMQRQVEEEVLDEICARVRLSLLAVCKHSVFLLLVQRRTWAGPMSCTAYVACVSTKK